MAIGVTLATAYGTVTSTKNWAADDTLIVGAVTYTLKASPSAANEVDVGADEATTLANLAAAINGTGTSGTTYGADTVQPAGMYASANGAHTITITSRIPGNVGNSLILTEGTDSETAYSITRAMSGGSGELTGASGWFASLIALNQINAEVLSHLKVFTDAAD